MDLLAESLFRMVSCEAKGPSESTWAFTSGNKTGLPNPPCNVPVTRNGV